MLSEGYVRALVRRPRGERGGGSATGRLLRLDDEATLDSTGIVMTPGPAPSRPWRRRSSPTDASWPGPEEIFGTSGAVALYRRAMLDDIAFRGEYFDRRSLPIGRMPISAWRAQWRGWTSLYVPTAVAWHRRRVTPERRSALPAEINRYSVRNRFLLRLKNQSIGPRLAIRLAGPQARRAGGRLRPAAGVVVDSGPARRRPVAAERCSRGAGTCSAARRRALGGSGAVVPAGRRIMPGSCLAPDPGGQ